MVRSDVIARQLQKMLDVMHSEIFSFNATLSVISKDSENLDFEPVLSSLIALFMTHFMDDIDDQRQPFRK
jgi:hypothetical protein